MTATHSAPSLYQGRCHCGAVRFEVSTSVTPAARCNCSLCRRRGALMSAPVDASALRLLQGDNALHHYQFNTRVARHYFCRHCGVYPFHQTRRDPTRWRVNLGCLDIDDPYRLPAQVIDGAALSTVEGA